MLRSYGFLGNLAERRGALSFHCCGSVGSHFLTSYETCMRDFLESHTSITLRSADVPIIREESVLNLSFNRRSGEIRVLGLLLTASLWALIAKADQPVEFESIVTDGSSVFQNIIVGTGNTFEETNTAVGHLPLAANTTGNYDTAFGYYSLRLNTTGSVNTALGVGALLRNTTGSYNLAVGVEALTNNDSGVNNTAVGSYDTLLHNTTGSANTALGYAALYSNTSSDGNTAVGDDALYYNTTGAYNTAVGREAGLSSQTGSSNAFFGFYAGAMNVAGNDNVFLGHYAGINQTGSNNIAIGAFATGQSPAGNNQLSIGNIIFGNLSTGSVQIGSTQDNGVDKLQVAGSIIASQLGLSAIQTPPASSSTACVAGEIRVAPDSIYVCVATDTWRKAPLMPF